MRKSIAVLAYTAGIIDGEGSIKITKAYAYKGKYGNISLDVHNTNEWLTRWLQFQFGGRVYLTKDSSRKPHAKDGFRWRVVSQQAKLVLQLTLPYLQIKRPQAELALSFQKRRGLPSIKRAPEAKILDEADKILMSQYNHRGK